MQARRHIAARRARPLSSRRRMIWIAAVLLFPLLGPLVRFVVGQRGVVHDPALRRGPDSQFDGPGAR
ncbi:PLD nuclease N-terminal domain-containing protein [Kocuria palustris]|uniref:PLD nuclease N-terminal domain-containing protein n=1 Tax=Kocuria palustris TaxID=71999 RepID=UPI0032E7FC8D